MTEHTHPCHQTDRSPVILPHQFLHHGRIGIPVRKKKLQERRCGVFPSKLRPQAVALCSTRITGCHIPEHIFIVVGNVPVEIAGKHAGSAAAEPVERLIARLPQAASLHREKSLSPGSIHTAPGRLEGISDNRVAIPLHSRGKLPFKGIPLLP